MPDQNLTWRDGQIGDYQIPQDYDQPDPNSAVYLSSDEVQEEVKKRLNNNRAALAALYGIKERELDEFLAKPDPTSAREAFRDAFEAKMQTKAKGSETVESMPTVTLAEFLGDPELLDLYKAAVKEEMNSRNYKNAVFLNSIHHYAGDTLETPVLVPAGGASGVGKSFLKKTTMETVVAQSPKKRDAQNEVVRDGNDVVSVDNGIARSTLQVGKMVVQVAFSKNYKEISDYDDVNKELAESIGFDKKQIKVAASEAGLSLYEPVTHTKRGADTAIVRWAKQHDGYHPGKQKYDVVATNIIANEEVVRNQGVKRSQLQEAYPESEVKLNKRKLPAESKRYGRLILNLDQHIGRLKKESFLQGQKNSSQAANTFQKKGIPVINIDSTTRILVMFKQGKLEQVGPDEAELPGAFIIHKKVLEEWRKTGQTGTTEAEVNEFAKKIALGSPIKVSNSVLETQALREAYAIFYKKYNRPDRELLSIENFNEFLRLTKIQSDSKDIEIDRNKLLAMLSVALLDKKIAESTCSKFLTSHFNFAKPIIRYPHRQLKWKKQCKKLLRIIVDLPLDMSMAEHLELSTLFEKMNSGDNKARRNFSYKLIDLVSDNLGKLYKKVPPGEVDAVCLKVAIDFLKNRKRPWLPFRRALTKGDEILINKLKQKLLAGQLDPSIVSIDKQKELGNMLSAAVELKKVNHESKIGSLFRRLGATRNNDTDEYESTILDTLGIPLKPVKPETPEMLEKPEKLQEPENLEPENLVSAAAPPPTVVTPAITSRTALPSDQVVVEVEKGAEKEKPTTLKEIQTTLALSRQRQVREDPNKLWVAQAHPGPPKYPQVHYTVEVDNAHQGALCYRAPLDQKGEMNREALKLACEDAVFLAKPGDILDLSQTPDSLRVEVETELKAAIARQNKTNLKIVFNKGPELTARTTLGSP